MKAAIFTENKILIKEIENPVLKETGAIIKVRGCGLCGSDIVKSRHGIEVGEKVLGHEVVGEIVEINSSKSTFNVGDNVVLGHHVPCYECKYCQNKSYSMCKSFKKTNIFPGGFAEYIYVSEEHLLNTVAKITSDISDVQASYTEPLACCLRAVKRAGVKAGDTVLISGLGSIGLLMGQAVKSFGAKVIGSDLLDERLDLAVKSGFDDVIKYTNINEFTALIKTKTNNFGVDKVFLVSGSASTLSVAVKSVIDGGVIVVFSSVASEKEGFANNEIYYREITVMGAYSASPAEIGESLNLIENNKIYTDNYATIYKLDELEKAINDTISNKILKAYIEIS